MSHDSDSSNGDILDVVIHGIVIVSLENGILLFYEMIDKKHDLAKRESNHWIQYASSIYAVYTTSRNIGNANGDLHWFRKVRI